MISVYKKQHLALRCLKKPTQDKPSRKAFPLKKKKKKNKKPPLSLSLHLFLETPQGQHFLQDPVQLSWTLPVWESSHQGLFLRKLSPLLLSGNGSLISGNLQKPSPLFPSRRGLRALKDQRGSQWTWLRPNTRLGKGGLSQYKLPTPYNLSLTYWVKNEQQLAVTKKVLISPLESKREQKGGVLNIPPSLPSKPCCKDRHAVAGQTGPVRLDTQKLRLMGSPAHDCFTRTCFPCAECSGITREMIFSTRLVTDKYFNSSF